MAAAAVVRMLVFVLPTVLAAGCRDSGARAEPPPAGGRIEALYRHLETTGLMDELTLSDGRRGRFRQLIHVRGTLQPVIRTDPTKQPFQRFELEDWYLELPVEVAFAARGDSVSEGIVKRVVNDAREANCPPLRHDGAVVDMQGFFRSGWSRRVESESPGR